MSKVSICMAVHNGERYLSQQLDSILPQLGTGDEFIISDDYSTDNSVSLIKAYQDTRIKLLPAFKQKGPITNFEYALGHCQNEFIFLADQDDVWHPGKIEIMTTALELYDLAICDCRIVDENLKELYPSFFNFNRSGRGLVRNFIKSSFIGCCMAFRKEVLSRALPFPHNTPMHDQWIGLVAQRFYKVHFVKEVLVSHRRHDHNYSSTAGQSKFSLIEKLSMRVHLAKNLFTA